MNKNKICIVLNMILVLVGVCLCNIITEAKESNDIIYSTDDIVIEEPELLAQHAILIEANTGRVIYEKNADAKAQPASLTKMLTCIISLENNDLDRILTVSPEAAASEDAYVGLKAGEQLTEFNLLKGLMMVSDNSSAVVLAEGLCGNNENFAKLMNDKAREIGLTNSNFVTPNGLPAENHYSTARDMASIAAYAWKNNRFRSICSTKYDTIEWQLPFGKKFDVENSNELLGKVNGVKGIKTGWTTAAGGCLAVAAKRDDVELIVVVMKSEDKKTRFDDAEKLLEYGFQSVQKIKYLDRKLIEKNIWLTNAEDYKVKAHMQEIGLPVLYGDNEDDYSIDIMVDSVIEAPIHKDQQVGTATVYYKGNKLTEVPMLADDDVNEGNNIISFFINILHKIGFFK